MLTVPEILDTGAEFYHGLYFLADTAGQYRKKISFKSPQCKNKSSQEWFKLLVIY